MTTVKFEMYEVVRFIGPQDVCPELEIGELGAVLEVYGDGWFMVEFSRQDGTTIVWQPFPETSLEKTGDPTDIPSNWKNVDEL